MVTDRRPARHAALALMLTAIGCTSVSRPQARPNVAPVPTAVVLQQVVADDRATTDAARLLVRRGAMDVVVDDVARAAARAQSVLVGANGYVERGQRSERSASFTIRVPEQSLDAVLDSLATMGKVASRTVSAEDVTEQSIDLDARLQALIATRDRLRQLHDKAATVAEVIAVEHELSRVQGEVDSLEGRLKHLRSTAALATVDLSIRQKIILGPLGVVAQALGNLITKLFVIR
jgi:hypothetical protein